MSDFWVRQLTNHNKHKNWYDSQNKTRWILLLDLIVILTFQFELRLSYIHYWWQIFFYECFQWSLLRLFWDVKPIFTKPFLLIIPNWLLTLCSSNYLINWRCFTAWNFNYRFENSLENVWWLLQPLECITIANTIIFLSKIRRHERMKYFWQIVSEIRATIFCFFF